jgi:hypothetical protein
MTKRRFSRTRRGGKQRFGRTRRGGKHRVGRKRSRRRTCRNKRGGFDIREWRLFDDKDNEKLVVWYKKIIEMEYGDDSLLLGEDNKLSPVGKVHYDRLKNVYANLLPDRRQFIKTKWPYKNEPDSIPWTNKDAASFSFLFISDNMKDIITYDTSASDVLESFELFKDDRTEWEDMLNANADAKSTTRPSQDDIHAVWVAFMFFTGRADLNAGAEEKEEEEDFRTTRGGWATPR